MFKRIYILNCAPYLSISWALNLSTIIYINLTYNLHYPQKQATYQRFPKIPLGGVSSLSYFNRSGNASWTRHYLKYDGERYKTAFA